MLSLNTTLLSNEEIEPSASAEAPSPGLRPPSPRWGEGNTKSRDAFAILPSPRRGEGQGERARVVALSEKSRIYPIAHHPIEPAAGACSCHSPAVIGSLRRCLL